MKYIAFFFLLIVASVTAKAQDTNEPKRDISLLIFDKKGRPIDGIIVRSLNNTKAGMTDRKGLFVFNDLTDSDMLSMFLPKYGETIIPVVGMDSIVVTLRSLRRHSYVSNEGRKVYINKPNSPEPTTVLDVQALLEQHPYRTVSELLQGHVPGLNITSGTTAGSNASVTIRGQNTLMLSSEPLVVIDGSPSSVPINDINVYDIKAIEVQKGGDSQWGVRGANGVILITTR